MKKRVACIIDSLKPDERPQTIQTPASKWKSALRALVLPKLLNQLGASIAVEGGA